MTLATRCSRCGTVFRLEQAALNAAEGWVRCGRCREVFNAIESLFEPKPAAIGEKLVATAADAAETEVNATDERTVADFDAAAGSDGEAESGTELIGPTAEGAPDATDHEPLSTPDDGASPVDASIATDTATPDTATPDAVKHDAVTQDTVTYDTAASHTTASDTTATDTTATDTQTAATIPAALSGEDDARDLRAARMSLFGPDSQLDDDSRFDTQVGDDGLERMSLWSDTRPAPPRRRTRRARPKAAVHRDDRDFELSETTVDVASAPMPMPSVEAVDHLLASNDRDTTFAEYEPTSGYEISTRPVHRRRPSMRLALRIAAIGLGVGLLLQSVLHARDSIAAHWPQAEPLLRSLCAPFGCEVEALRDLKALQVQSVTFQEAGTAGLYDLNVVLVNRSDLRVRMPALDLRISDARGAVAARRVLTAAEMEHPERSIAPRSEAALQANLRIEQANVSGYEVTVFYP
jgi:predicted Zn finger-like uncharacterized protein